MRRNLRSPGRAAEWAKVDWSAVQLEILSSSWIHRIQKLEFPAIEVGGNGRPKGEVVSSEMMGAILGLVG